MLVSFEIIFSGHHINILVIQGSITHYYYLQLLGVKMEANNTISIVYYILIISQFYTITQNNPKTLDVNYKQTRLNQMDKYFGIELQLQIRVKKYRKHTVRRTHTTPFIKQKSSYSVRYIKWCFI